MNFLIGITCALLICLISAEQLYHREGRFIDFSIHRYKSQLPSVHDIANSFIHYRMPIAIFVPTVRLNIKPKQRKTHYSSFPTAPTKTTEQPEVTNNRKESSVDESEDQKKSNKELNQPIISRNGWRARSLSKPKSVDSLLNYGYKLQSRNNGPKYRSLNYATQLPSESNVDLMPFLYKEHVPGQSSGLFNSPYQLTNSNPSQMFSKNIAYIQPNSLNPFQPNILFLSTPEKQTTNDRNKTDNQSIISDKQQNGTVTIIGANSTVDKITPSNGQLFNVIQSSDSEEIAQEHIQNHEPVENVPVSVVESMDENSTFVNSAGNLTTLIISKENSTTSINQPQIDEKDKASDLIQSIDLPVVNQPVSKLKSELDLINELALSDPYRLNLVKKLYSYPVSSYSLNQIKPKNVIAGRRHRSLQIDMPSYSTLLTAAVAQSGHSRENRRNLFTRFLNDNVN